MYWNEYFVLQVFPSQWGRGLGYERGCVYLNDYRFSHHSGGGGKVMRESVCIGMNILYYRLSHHSGGRGLGYERG